MTRPTLESVCLLDWSLTVDGVQVYKAPDHPGQWYTAPVECPECGKRWTVVAPLGLVGAECVFCHFVSMSYVWGSER